MIYQISELLYKGKIYGIGPRVRRPEPRRWLTSSRNSGSLRPSITIWMAEIKPHERVRPFKIWATDPITDDRDFLKGGSNPERSNKIRWPVFDLAKGYPTSNLSHWLRDEWPRMASAGSGAGRTSTTVPWVVSSGTSRDGLRWRVFDELRLKTERCMWGILHMTKAAWGDRSSSWQQHSSSMLEGGQWWFSG
jgi:hypothetical protein